MRYLMAAVICGGVFVAYGLACLALGWQNLGGAIPVILLLIALTWLWRHIINDDGARPKTSD